MGESYFVKKKEAFANWAKDPYNAIFLAILVFSIIIRIYYWWLTKGQTIWWDESDYLAYAKNLAGLNSDWIVTQQHNSLFPFIVAVFFFFGISEPIIKLFVEILPSIGIVALSYFIGIKMYNDKKVGLIAAAIAAVLWVLLFNTMRFHLGAPGIFTGMLAIYVFWQGYERKEKIFGKINPRWAIPIAAALVIITYTIRRGYLLFGAFFFFYLILTKKWKVLFKDKNNWIGLGVAVALFLIAEMFIFTADIGGVSQTYVKTDRPITLVALDVIPAYFSAVIYPFTNFFLYFFWIGALVMVATLFLSFGHMKKSSGSKARADLFNLLSVVITLLFFILVLRIQGEYGEARWYLPLMFGCAIAIARGMVSLSDYIEKYNKAAAIVVLVVMVLLAGYAQLNQADGIIKGRINSFDGLRKVSLYLHENSQPTDIIISQPVPQAIYYAERSVTQPEHIAGVKGAGFTVEQFIQGLRENPEAKYLIITFSEPGYTEWMRKTVYVNHNGQAAIGAWEIPFLDTTINFATGQQDIKQSKTIDEFTFRLLLIEGDAFLYEIIREETI